MAESIFEEFDQHSLEALAGYLERLSRTHNSTLAKADVIAKRHALLKIQTLINSLSGLPTGFILDLMTAYLWERCLATQAQVRGLPAPEASDMFELWFWYSDLRHQVLWGRINFTPLELRMKNLIELLDKHDPTWRTYIRRDMCLRKRSERSIVSQVLAEGKLLSLSETMELAVKLGLPRGLDIDQSMLWLARRGLIASDLRAGKDLNDDQHGLRAAWWLEASTHRPNPRARRRTAPAPILRR